MFWKFGKKESSKGGEVKRKLPGPKSIVEKVARDLIVEKNQNPDWIWQLNSVTRPDNSNPKAVQFRVYDPTKTVKDNFSVRDYHSFDEHPEYIVYDGCYYKDKFEVDYNDEK